jgi:hypothetical protein
MKGSEKMEWGWMKQDQEQAHGVFPTREEAVKDAEEYSDTPIDKLIFGHCVWADATCYLPSMDEFMDRLNECAYNDDYGFWEDEVFDICCGTPGEAEKAFDEMLKTWAQKYLVGACWTLIPETTAAPSGAGDEGSKIRKEKP